MQVLMSLGLLCFGSRGLGKFASSVYNIDQNNFKKCFCGKATFGAASDSQSPPLLAGEAQAANNASSSEYNDYSDSEENVEKTLKKPYYPPYQRPWLTTIEITTSHKETKDYCAGAIIAPRWIITSKTCLGGEDYGDKVKERHKMEQIVIHVGFGEIMLNNSVGEIVLHDENITYTDLALLKLDKPLKIASDRLPICLPQDDFFQDENIRATISGYNYPPRKKKCLTVSGPSRNKRCSFPFITKDQEKHNKCTRHEPDIHQECKLLEIMKGLDPSLGLNQTLSINYIIREVNNTNVTIECYDENVGDNGWCGTCLYGAKKGQPGYCEEIEDNKPQPMAEEHEMPRPSKWGGWGVCHKNCSPKQADHPELLEDEYDIWSHNKCDFHLNRSGQQVLTRINNQPTQMCVYQRREAFLKQVYLMKDLPESIRDLDSDNELFKNESKKVLESRKNTWFQMVRVRKEYGQKTEETEEDRFIDPGAPVFRWIDEEHAVLIGVVSGRHSPPRKNILQLRREHGRQMVLPRMRVSRVLPLMGWIKKHIDTEENKCVPVN